MPGPTETPDRIETPQDGTRSVCLVEADLTGKIIGAAVVHRELGEASCEEFYSCALSLVCSECDTACSMWVR